MSKKNIKINTGIISLFTYIILTFSCVSHAPNITLNDIFSDYEYFEKVTIPMKLDANIFPYIEIEIQDVIIPLHVDTGYNGSIDLTMKQLNQIKFEETKYSQKVYNANGIFTVKTLKTEDIKIGSIKLNSTYVYENKFFKPSFLNDFGTIGWGFLNKFNVLLDYNSNELTLYNINIQDFDLNGWNKVDLINDEDIISFYANLQSSNKKVKFSIDSGAIMTGKNEVYNMMQAKAYNDGLKDNERSKITSGYTIIHDIIIQYGENSYLTEDFLVYDIGKNIPKMSDFILGGDFLHNHKVYIDNKNNLLYFKERE